MQTILDTLVSNGKVVMKEYGKLKALLFVVLLETSRSFPQVWRKR